MASPNSSIVINELRAAHDRLTSEIEELDEARRQKVEQRRSIEVTLRMFKGQNTVASNLEEGHADTVTTDAGLNDAIYELLHRNGPLHRREIFDRLIQSSMTIGGQSPINTMAAHLSHDPRFKSVGDGRWGLFDEQIKQPHITQGDNLKDAIYEILATDGPLHRSVIYERLIENGARVGGQRPIDNVGAHMSQDYRFMSRGGGLWDLVEKPDGSGETKTSNFKVEDGNDELEDEDEEDVPW